MINAADTKNAAAGIPSDSRHNPLMREREKHQEDYTSGMVLPTRPKKRKEGITMKRITLKKARLIANMTEEEVCTALRIRKDRLHAWETGKSVPSIDHAFAMAVAYDISIDYLDFSKEANTPPTARKLTIEEIKALPFASIIWYSNVSNDNGVVWHWKTPVVVYCPGDEGWLGGDAFGGGVIEKSIDDDMFSNPNDSYWNSEPTDDQLPGITKDEYNELWNGDEEDITMPKLAEAITGRKITFEKICNLTGIDFGHFTDAMTGKEDFTCGELATIARELNTTVDEIFFKQAPDGHVALAQI